jgi:hypothetical protein
MMNWLKLKNNQDSPIGSGSALMVPPSDLNEDGMIIMICEAPAPDRKCFATMALTGVNKGVNCLSRLPHSIYGDVSEKSLTTRIYDNWQAWFQTGNRDEVLVACNEYPDGVVTSLDATDIQERTNGWLRLADNKTNMLPRGTLVRFSASHPFEEQVVMMVCDSSLGNHTLGLITISGYHAGFNCHSSFPDSTRNESATISAQWLYDNWQHWVWPEGSPNDVWILSDGLSADDLK